MTGLAWVLLTTLLGPADDPVATGLETLSQRVLQGYQQQGLVAPNPPVLTEAARSVAALFPELQRPLQVFSLRLPDPDARALPGARVLFNEGLWPYLWTEDALVFVLAHEAAHLALDHPRQRFEASPGDGDGRRIDWELAADAEALRRMREHDRPLGPVAAMVERLAADERAPPQSRLDALRSALPAPVSRPPDENLGPLHQAGLQLWLDHGRTDSAARLLSALPAHRFNPMRYQLGVRLGQSMGDDAALGTTGKALQLRALAALQRGDDGLAASLWSRWLQVADGPESSLVRAWIEHRCGVDSGSETNNLRGSRPRRFHNLRYALPEGWRPALQTRERLVLTPDHSALTRLDLWSPGSGPGGRRTVPEPGCSPLSFWRALAGLRRELAPAPPALVQVRPLASGWAATADYRDASGIQWRLMLVRRESLTALLRAPRGEFFERHRAAALGLVLGAEIASD